MSKLFFNLTNHSLTNDQLNDVKAKGATVIELPEDLKKAWGACDPDNWKETKTNTLNFVIEYDDGGERDFDDEVVILLAGYAPLICNLTNSFSCNNFKVVYADSKRESVEKTLEDGSVIKQNVFKHRGFYDIISGDRW